MRLNEATNTVEFDGLTETQAFSINVTGKAFKILLDGLYANKIGAVIRELSTNAYDAHLAIGAGAKPFKVTLPTTWEPHFKVRDYGISMNHADAMRLMSTLFDSTKDKSNTMVGAFGLGSKSPFSLVDTFNLTIFLDGEKRSYSAFFGADGVPTLALLGREPSKEPRGVEFCLTIDQKDVRAFETNARVILQWFPTIPDVYQGVHRLLAPIVSPSSLASGKGWQLVGSNIINRAYARQGCVVYPLDVSAIPGIPNDVAQLMAAPIVIDFPIGSLDVVASREALSYDQPTKANIIARLNSVSREIRDHYGKAIHDAPTLWEAGTIRSNLMHNSNLPRALIRVVEDTKWQGTTLPNYAQMGAVSEALEKVGVKIAPYVWDDYRIRRMKTALGFDENSLWKGQNCHVYYGDKRIHLYFTVENERPTHEGKRLKMVAPTNNDYMLVIVLTDAAHQQAVLDALGNPPHKGWTKDLAAPAVKPRANVAKRGVTKKVEVKVRRIKFYPGNHCTLANEEVINLDGSATYAITLGGNITGLGPNHDDSVYLNNFLAEIAMVDSFETIQAQPIYVISSTYQKRLEAFIAEGGDWVSIQDRVTSKPDLVKHLTDALMLEAVQKNIRKFSQDSPWVKLLKDSPIARRLAATPAGGSLYQLAKTYADLGLTYEPYANVALPLHRGLYGFRMFGIDHRDIMGEVEAALGSDNVLTRLHLNQRACEVSYPLVSSRVSDYRPVDLLRYIEAVTLLDEADRQRRMNPLGGLAAAELAIVA